MRRKLRMLTVCLAVVLLATETDSLWCYQCGTTSNVGLTSGCITDIQGLINSSLGLNQLYVKDCTSTRSTFDRCMIETAEFQGKYGYYNRDCHDGVNFPQSFTSHRFQNVTANNASTCDSIGNNVVCYSFCDTDFCNGPQAPPNKTICDQWIDDPDSVELADNMTCGANAIYGTKNRPMGVEILCLIMASLFLIGLVGSS